MTNTFLFRNDCTDKRAVHSAIQGKASKEKNRTEIPEFQVTE